MKGPRGDDGSDPRLGLIIALTVSSAIFAAVALCAAWWAGIISR